MPSNAVWIRKNKDGGFTVIPVKIIRLYPETRLAEVDCEIRGIKLRIIVAYSELSSDLTKAKNMTFEGLEKIFSRWGDANRALTHCTKTAPRREKAEVANG